MRGSKLQKLILDYLEACQYPAINIMTASKNGESDIVACIEGKFCLIEVKGAGDTIRRLQQIKQDRVKEAGGYAIFAYSLADVRTLVSKITAK